MGWLVVMLAGEIGDQQGDIEPASHLAGVGGARGGGGSPCGGSNHTRGWGSCTIRDEFTIHLIVAKSSVFAAEALLLRCAGVLLVRSSVQIPEPLESV